jgi:hypothetical protein
MGAGAFAAAGWGLLSGVRGRRFRNGSLGSVANHEVVDKRFPRSRGTANRKLPTFEPITSGLPTPRMEPCQ